jgi:hypothetical protein
MTMHFLHTAGSDLGLCSAVRRYRGHISYLTLDAARKRFVSRRQHEVAKRIGSQYGSNKDAEGSWIDDPQTGRRNRSAGLSQAADSPLISGSRRLVRRTRAPARPKVRHVVRRTLAAIYSQA